MFVMGLAFLDGERPTPAAIAALALGLIGLGVLVLGRSGSGGRLPAMGVVTILLASLAWAYGSWIKPRLVVPVNQWVGTAHQMVAAGLFLLVLSVARSERWSTAVGAPSALALAHLVVVGSIVGFTAYSWLLGKAPLGLIATHTFVNPVVAVALGTVFLDEPLSMPVLVDGSLIAVSVAVSIAEQLVRGRAAPNRPESISEGQPPVRARTRSRRTGPMGADRREPRSTWTATEVKVHASRSVVSLTMKTVVRTALSERRSPWTWVTSRSPTWHSAWYLALFSTVKEPCPPAR